MKMKYFVLLIIVLLLIILSAGNVSALYGTSKGRFAWWTFDEGIGTKAYDTVSGKYNITLSGTWTLGKFNSAYVPPGSEMVATGFNFAGITNFSIAFWIKRTGDVGVADAIFANGYGNSNQGELSIDLRVQNEIGFRFHNGTGYVSETIPLALNEWYFVVLTTNGTDIAMYVNGTDEVIMNKTGSYTINRPTDFTLFAYPSNDYKVENVVIDEIGIWNETALNVTEIIELYERPSYILTENYQVFNSTVAGGSSENFYINLTYNSSAYTNVIGTLYYNNTAYSGTQGGSGNNLLFNRGIVVPRVSSTTYKSFVWEVGLYNGSWNYYNSTTNVQGITTVAIDDCSSYGQNILNLTLKDEETQNYIDGDIYNTSIKLTIELYSNDNSALVANYSKNFSEKNTTNICLDNLNGTYKMDARITYDGDGYALEYYHIQNSSVYEGNSQAINLLDLSDSSSQAFRIIFKDENFLAVEGALVQIQREYVNEGVSKTVEIPKTDSSGETIGHFQLNDAIYDITVTKNGVTLATFNDVVAVCQNPSLENCEMNLNSIASAISPTDYTIGDDFTFYFTYTATTRVVESVFTIPSGTSATVLLNVTLFDNLGATEACSHSLTSTSGTLSCTVPQSLGNGTVIARLYKSGTLVGETFIKVGQSASDIYGSNIVFLGLLLILMLIGISVQDNPMITGIFIIIGAICLIALNLVDTGLGTFIGASATFLWIALAVIIILIKGAKRQ